MSLRSPGFVYSRFVNWHMSLRSPGFVYGRFVNWHMSLRSPGFVYSRFVNWHMSLRSPGFVYSRFVNLFVVPATSAKFGLHAGNVKFSTQNERRLSVLMFIIVPCMFLYVQ
jgi:hypothetical protein